jgi:16S rRNA (cytosine1402-N4)-methyltransferase
MSLSHRPVMLQEMLEALAPAPGEIHVDGTLGAGGYARAILSAAECRLAAFDRDPSAIRRAKVWAHEFGSRLALIERPFAEIEEGLADIGVDAIDGAVFDLGVSSMQLDEADRGFSFRADGPLSMRMDGGRPDAAEVVNRLEAADLAAIFKAYGEERHAARIARAIVRDRAGAPIVSTLRLADIVATASPKRPEDAIHPATRVFQALRIFVNDELNQLAEALAAAERLLKPAGRLVVVTFHSLEDRIVKRFFTDRSSAAPAPSRHAPREDRPAPTFSPQRKPQSPGKEEIAGNPRARSAKLRAGVRSSAPARADRTAFAPPTLFLSKTASHWR